MAKVADGAATVPVQLKSTLTALEREKQGYEARIAAIEADAEDRLSKERLTKRIGEVDAEIKRVKSVLGKQKDDE